jgi:acyl-CoA synthetase (AMP-forming)/AMP-acid ligase II/acyl carrier protein
MLNGRMSNSASEDTLVDVVRRRAVQDADRLVYTFLADGEVEEDRLTFAQLDYRARTVAALLQRHRARGERALLLFPPGLDYIVAFLGCLMAGVVAVPAYPPRRNRSLGRLQTIVDDARIKFVLTSSRLRATLSEGAMESAGLANVQYLATDVYEAGLADEWAEWRPTGDDLAFLQYTSGSTGNPKGVMVSHGNLSHNLTQTRIRFQLSPETTGASWLPPYHDMGLIGNILQTIWTGFHIVLMSHVDFLQRPMRWIEAISRYRVTGTGGPTFAYDLCARRVEAKDLEGLDLSPLKLAYVGAEPVRPDVFDRFVAAFAPCGFRRETFYPVYGLAEGTLLVSAGRPGDPPVVRHFSGPALTQRRVDEVSPTDESGLSLVGCGDTLADQEIAIVNPETATRCQPDEIGEIWLSGPSVAQGYFNQPEATARDFQARLADDGRGPFLRTGDLGFIGDGGLYITGRLKDLIIIRGANYYPQDIELTAEKSHPALRAGAGAAFSIVTNGEEQVIVVYELNREHRHPDVPAIAAAIREAVAEENGVHVREVVLIRTATIPKTSSGKIQRYACRAAYLDGTLEVVGRVAVEPSPIADSGSDSTAAEASLTRDALLALGASERPGAITTYFQQLIAPLAQIAAEDVRIDQALLSFGFDSLMAVELISRVATDLGVTIDIDSLNPDVTIEQLTTQILERLTPVSAPAPAPRA